MPYLFQCTIGPVQDFIASARRSRDLWYGSWMLSELSKAAAKAIADQHGRECLVFPAVSEDGWLDPATDNSVANKVVAIIPHEPDDLGNYVQEKTRQRLRELRDEAFGHVRGPYKSDLAQAQVNDLLEFYWVAVDLIDEKKYPQVRDWTEMLMEARKNTRDFRQAYGNEAPKSSLDGIRESVIPAQAYPSWSDPNRGAKLEALYRNYGARGAEQLSGVDLMKRLGRHQRGRPDFPSTSDIAAKPLLARLDRDGHSSKQLLDALQGVLRENGLVVDNEDGSLLFQSRLREWATDENSLKQAEQTWESWVNDNIGQSVRPDPYYALLVADGDGMGEVIDAYRTPDDHRKVSQALSQYARTARGIIREDSGALVYAGGDDVLAFLPLHTVRQCAERLARAFADHMKQFHSAAGRSPTLSAGIAISHHLESLSDALELARKAERRAKSVPGKDALAITISRRSGVDRTIADKSAKLHERLSTLVDLYRREAIPKGVAYELEELDRVLDSRIPGLRGAAAIEALRILERKRTAEGAKPASEALATITKWIGDATKTGEITVDELSRELIAASTFAAAEAMAFGDLQEVTKL